MTVSEERKIRARLRSNHIARFISMFPWKKWWEPFLEFFSPSEFTLILSTNISISAITVSILFMLVLCNLSTDEMEFEISSDQRTGKPIACRVVRLEAGSVSFEVCYLTPKITRYSKCKCEKNFVLASVIKTPKSLGGGGLKYYPSVLQESQQLFFCCRSSSSYYWHVFEFVPIWITLQSYICLFNWNWTCLWNTQTIIDINPICWQINFIFRFEVRKQYVEW